LKWDRLIALAVVVAGTAWAGHSATQYFQKLDAIRELPETYAVSASAGRSAVPSGSPGERPEEAKPVVFPEDQRPRKGEHFADLIIPRLRAVMPVVEGTREEELARGVGHYAQSVLPGEPDNSVLSGHRDTVFRRIGQLKKGDELHIRTAKGTFVYKIIRTWVTSADDRSVIVPHGKPVLTLTTCYPFSYVGPAPERYIIQAVLTRHETNGSSKPGQGG